MTAGGDVAYDTLASVYEWLVPDALLTPDGAVAAFAGVVETLPAGGRVLDCAAGAGQLAVGLALRGFEVAASDASAAMVERITQLAAQHGVSVRSMTCPWEDLTPEGFGGCFDAVFCVGNSLTHARGRPARRAALKNMASMLRPGGLLVVTSRNWELVRRLRSGLDIADELVTRRGRQGLVIYQWTLADAWQDEHSLDVAVALLDPGGSVTTIHERLSFWPFTHDELDEDLRQSGLMPGISTYAPDAERYLVPAVRL